MFERITLGGSPPEVINMHSSYSSFPVMKSISFFSRNMLKERKREGRGVADSLGSFSQGITLLTRWKRNERKMISYSRLRPRSPPNERLFMIILINKISLFSLSEPNLKTVAALFGKNWKRSDSTSLPDEGKRLMLPFWLLSSKERRSTWPETLDTFVKMNFLLDKWPNT